MTPSEYYATIPRYADLKASLEAYNPDATREHVRTAAARSVSQATLRGWKSFGQRNLDGLPDILGAWYAHGPWVGDETVVDFCVCHSLQAVAQQAAPDEQVEAVTDAVMAQIDLARAWRQGLIDWLESANAPELADEHALVGLVECLVDLGIGEAWYVHLAPAVSWMVDASGRPPTKKLAEAIADLTSTWFSSWAASSPESTRRFAEDAAWAIVEARLDNA